MNDAQTLTETPTTTAVEDAAKATLDGINQLKALADEALGRVVPRHRRSRGQRRRPDRGPPAQLVGGAAWLARD